MQGKKIMRTHVRPQIDWLYWIEPVNPQQNWWRLSLCSHQFGVEGPPEEWKTWSTIPDVAFHRGNLVPLKRCRWLENSSYEWTNLGANMFCFCFLRLHFPELRRPMLNSDCTNAYALDGVRKLLLHRCTTFVYSLMNMLQNGVEPPKLYHKYYTTKKQKLCHINGRTDPIKRRSALKSPKFHTPSACIKLTPRTMCNISSLLHLPIGRKFLPRYWWKMVHMKCRWLERRSLFPLRCFGLVFPWAICECVHYFDFWHPTSIAQTGCVSDFLVRNQDLVGAPSRKSEDYGVRLLENQKPTPKNV